MFAFRINGYEVLLIKTIVEVNALIKDNELTKKQREAKEGSSHNHGGVPVDSLLKDDSKVLIFKRTKGNGDYEFTTITCKQIE